MNELPYFYFIVLAEPQAWPYYAEIPYAAWPDESMSYNSNGTCRQPYDREWLYLDVMNWETHENIVVCDASSFDSERADATRALIENNLNDGDDLLANSHVARLLLHLLNAIPAEYRTRGNVIISSFRCNKPAITAAIADLFMRRLQAQTAWDAQTGQTIDASKLHALYLKGFPIEASQKIADEVRHWFAEAESKHQAQIDTSIDWWKTLAQVRQYVQGEHVAN
jgi:hypothetical protein